jgi:hypothetical protein
MYSRELGLLKVPIEFSYSAAFGRCKAKHHLQEGIAQQIAAAHAGYTWLQRATTAQQHIKHCMKFSQRDPTICKPTAAQQLAQLRGHSVPQCTTCVIAATQLGHHHNTVRSNIAACSKLLCKCTSQVSTLPKQHKHVMHPHVSHD